MYDVIFQQNIDECIAIIFTNDILVHVGGRTIILKDSESVL